MAQTQDEPMVIDDLATARQVNKYAELDDQIKALKKEQDKIKAQFKGRGVCILASSTIQIPIRQKTKRTLDKDAVTKELGEQWVAEHTNESDYIEVGSPTRRKAELGKKTA